MIISINNVLEYQIDSEELFATLTTTPNQCCFAQNLPLRASKQRQQKVNKQTPEKNEEKKSHLFKIDPTIALNTRDVTSRARRRKHAALCC